jgi:hypothetical protein
MISVYLLPNFVKKYSVNIFCIKYLSFYFLLSYKMYNFAGAKKKTLDIIK